MRIHWHTLEFKHTCGRQGTILEVLVSCDGSLCLSGLCVICGEEFSESHPWASVMVNATIADYQKNLELKDPFEGIDPTKKPN